MGPLASKIEKYRTSGGDPQLYAIMLELGQRCKANEQALVKIARHLADLSQVLHVQSAALGDVVQGMAAARAKALGIEVGTDPYLTGEASEDQLPPSPGRT